jgi:hypothetical protein
LALGSGLKLTFAAFAACALLGAAAASAAKPAPKRQPTFRVTVTSTYVDHNVITVVEVPNANGCRQRYDLNATQTINVSTTKSVLRTLAQVKAGQFPPLQAREHRTGTERNGWEIGCPSLKDDPADITDTSGCGDRSYAMTKTSLGYLAKTGTRFAFRYSRNAADPYGGNCLPEAFDDPNADTDVSPVEFPPAPFGEASGKKPFWAELARTRLTGTKTITLTFHDTAKVSEPFLEPDPTLETNITSDEYSVTWEVKLVPVKPAKK